MSILSHERDVVVLADALEHEKRRRDLAAVRDQMRTARYHTIGLTRTEPHFLFRVAQEEPDRPLDDVERILDVAVVMPWHALRWADLQFADAESRPLGVQRSPLHFVDVA